MSLEININDQPTFDLTEFVLKYFDDENQVAYFESVQIFSFDKVYGTITNRSRVTRVNHQESTLIKQVISASIDAGYTGKLVWKTELTKRGAKLLADDTLPREEVLGFFKNCQQIHLFPAKRNYYQGSHQTALTPDIVFISDQGLYDTV